ncbi:MAG: InlB B-repeat-containing protein, partial [Clostridiales bacterium]
QETNGSYSFTMPKGDVTISAASVQNVFDIIKANTQHATVTSKDTATVGETVNFTVTANTADYVIQSVKVTSDNGNTVVPLSKSADGTYSFTMPNKDVTITPTVAFDRFTVTTAPGANSTITNINPTNTVKAGTTVSFEAKANTNYKLTSVKAIYDTDKELKLTETNGTYTFTMPAYDVTIQTVAVQNTFTITHVDSNINTTLDMVTPNAMKADAGTRVNFTAVATNATDNILKSVVVTDADNKVLTLDKETNGSYSFTMPTENVTITTESVKNRYAIATNPDHATITPSAQNATVGETVTFTVNAADTYAIRSVYVADKNNKKLNIVTESENTYSFTMPDSDVTISNVAVINSFDVTPQLDAKTELTNTTLPAKAKLGETVNFALAVKTGDSDYIIDTVKVVYGTDDQYSITPSLGTDGRYSFTMPAYDVKITSTVVQNVFAINKGVEKDATIAVTNNLTKAAVGTAITFTATPTNNDYIIKDVLVTCGANTVPTTNSNGIYSFNMPKGAVTISATVSQNVFAIHKVETDATINITKPDPAIQTKATAGASVTFTAKATDKKKIVDTIDIVDGSGNPVAVTPLNDAANSYTFTMPKSAVTITPNVVKNSFAINTVNSPNTKVELTTPATGNESVAGEEVIFTATPDTYYILDKIKITYNNGVNVDYLQDGNKITFTMPKADVSITAISVKNVFDITVNHALTSNTNVTITDPTGDPKKAAVGKNVTFTAVPEQGNVISEIKVTASGETVTYVKTNKDTYNFTMPKSDVSITAISVKNTFNVVASTSNPNVTILPAELRTATTGDAVEFTVKADANYGIDNILIQKQTQHGYINPTYVSTADDGTSTWSFIMPADDVVISATAVKVDLTLTILSWDGSFRGMESVKHGATYPDLMNDYSPLPREGYTFKAYMDLNSHTVFNHNTPVLKNTVIKAIYTANPQTISAAPETSDAHLDKLDVETTNSGVVVSKNLLVAGEELVSCTGADATIKVKASPHYKITNVAVRAENNNHNVTNVPISQTNYDSTTGIYTYTFTMPAKNVEVYVATEAVAYNVDVNIKSITEGGIYTLNGGNDKSITAKQGSKVDLSVEPTPGYKLSQIVVSYLSDNGKDIAYPKNIDATVGSTINDVPLNSNDARYKALLSGTDFAFIMPQNNVSITLAYEKIDYTIDTTTSNTASIQPINKGNVVANIPARNITGNTTTNITNAQLGDDVQLVVTPEYGYNLKDLTVKDVNGNLIALKLVTANNYTFTMPVGNVTVTATFVKDKYTVTFCDWNDKVLGETQLINYKELPTLPADPTRVGYDFVGWASADVDPVVTAENPSKVNTSFPITKATKIIAVYTPTVYNINYMNGGNGTITTATTTASADATFTNTAANNSVVTFKPTPAAGYQINQVTASYVDYENKTHNIDFTAVADNLVTGGDYTFTMPAGVVTVKVTFKPIEYNVSLIANDTNNICGTTYLDNKLQLATTTPYKGTVTITANPNEINGWELATITVVGASGNVALNPATVDPAGGTYTFTMPKEDVTVTVTYVQKSYNISYFDGNSTTPNKALTNTNGTCDLTNGEITNATANSQYQLGTPAFTVTPDSGYQIKSVTATFIDSAKVKQKIDFTEEATDLVNGGTYKYTMPASPVSIKVTLEKVKYAVTITEPNELNGKAEVLLNDVKAETVNADFKSTVNVKVTPVIGYEITSVVVTDVLGGNVAVTGPGAGAITAENYTFEMPARAVNVKVNMTPVTYKISYNTPANGTITLNDATKAFKDTAIFTATPATGYQIDTVTATYTDKDGKHDITFTGIPNDVKVGGVYAFTMPASDVAVTVTFKQIEYNVSLDSTIDLNGKADVTLNGATTTTTQAIFGSIVKVNVTPIVGYEVTSVVATDGAGDLTVTNPTTAIAKGGEFKFTMRSSNVIVKVNMTPVVYNVSYNVPVNGTYDAQAPSFAFGSDATFTVTPAAGYQIET